MEFLCIAYSSEVCEVSATSNNQESLKAFVKDGFSSWAKAFETLRLHEKSNLQHTARIVAATNAGVNVAASLSAGKQNQMADARIALLGIQSSLLSFTSRIGKSRKNRCRVQDDAMTASQMCKEVKTPATLKV